MDPLIMGVCANELLYEALPTFAGDARPDEGAWQYLLRPSMTLTWI
jgi:hypothetical protein